MDIGDPIKTTVEEIRKVLNIENVIGEVIETDDKVLIPVTKMGMGFGAGSGEGKAPQGNAGGGAAAAAGAAGIEPVAMVVIFKGVKGIEGVKVLSLKSPDALARVVSEVGTAAVEIMSQGAKMMKEKHQGMKHKGHMKWESEKSKEPEAEEKKV
ncbi:GerW family sporulation protein [Methanobacterium paludis]|jgi:uncharacterized spore protein YtfJ|uniref:Sporulation protein YtfJ n=1 Tax=Methanobacterium paludis (strain DSM 25820 / JCM 18151 / SWAN1) TaxID=868131 RepID=F6D6K4_METPW|nr:spore germination protein GerW family protein [Methanobacterium paludis]AEG17717.1 Sporulation protein YtfJ [Methanobacterium paludis]